jgi:hypothetical protein
MNTLKPETFIYMNTLKPGTFIYMNTLKPGTFIYMNTLKPGTFIDKISQQPENCENRNDPDLVQAFLKKKSIKKDNPEKRPT